MDAKRPSARPCSSSRVITALPNFITSRRAYFNWLRSENRDGLRSVCRVLFSIWLICCNKFHLINLREIDNCLIFHRYPYTFKIFHNGNLPTDPKASLEPYQLLGNFIVPQKWNFETPFIYNHMSIWVSLLTLISIFTHDNDGKFRLDYSPHIVHFAIMSLFWERPVNDDIVKNIVLKVFVWSVCLDCGSRCIHERSECFQSALSVYDDATETANNKGLK